jgi:hypothetical protein
MVFQQSLHLKCQEFLDVKMGGVADGWAAHPSPTHLPTHPSEKPFTSVILSVMPLLQNIKPELNLICTNNVKTHYNWSHYCVHGAVRVNEDRGVYIPFL